MKYVVDFSPEAKTHLQELEEYLSQRFYPANAEKYIQRLIGACVSLGIAPHRGTERSDLRAGIRTIGFERRVTIYFKVGEDRVTILGLMYGGRSFEPTP